MTHRECLPCPWWEYTAQLEGHRLSALFPALARAEAERVLRLLWRPKDPPAGEWRRLEPLKQR